MDLLWDEAKAAEGAPDDRSDDGRNAAPGIGKSLLSPCWPSSPFTISRSRTRGASPRGEQSWPSTSIAPTCPRTCAA